MGDFDTETDLFQGGTREDCFVRAKLLPSVQLDESNTCGLFENYVLQQLIDLPGRTVLSFNSLISAYDFSTFLKFL